MTKVSTQEASLIAIEEGNISRQLLAEFNLRLDEEIQLLIRRGVNNFQNQTLTPDASHAILCAISSMVTLKDRWKTEIAKGDLAAMKEFK